MLSINNPEPEVDFWDQLHTKVAQIQTRARKNVKKVKQTSKQPVRQKESGLTRFFLQQSWHRTVDQNKAISNRIGYLRHQKLSQYRTIQLTQLKVNKVTKIRNRSHQQKQQIRNQLILNQQQIDKTVSLKVSRIRDQRALITQSLQRVKAQREIAAKEIRDITVEDEAAIERERKAVIEKNKKTWEKAREETIQSKLSLSKMKEERIEMGRINFRSYIQNKYDMNQQQNRRNSILRNKLAESLATAKSRDDSLSHYQDEEWKQMRQIQSCMSTPRSKQKLIFKAN